MKRRQFFKTLGALAGMVIFPRQAMAIAKKLAPASPIWKEVTWDMSPSENNAALHEAARALADSIDQDIMKLYMRR